MISERECIRRTQEPAAPKARKLSITDTIKTGLAGLIIFAAVSEVDWASAPGWLLGH
jgi:hypothetical protein